ncbi:PREDICTED: uncharacterized protein LOC106123303 [Papilio xuthus]|uniref:Uncharacterized protein LOC106123303 n=1 Tax=Papilio xuthus TaxID=66420 RepID=A0AAJ7EF62_PAPXU|nr:PREDICTED: uncharacterized protein LOC106123303 [Papilio xuthus]
MLISFLLCNILWIPYIFGNSITSETPRDKSSKSVLQESHYEDYNKTNLNLVSEGGSLLPNAVVDIIHLPKDKHNILLSLDNEIGKNKEKSVVARKGVVYSSIEDTQVPANHTKIEKNNATGHKELDISKDIIKPNKINAPPVTSQKTINNIVPKDDSNDKNKTETPKKPLVLSNEALDQITLTDFETSYPKDGHKVKVPRNPNSHPGMIMPIVITILVVPMFAVVGYLAIKRGQEAWKNRHYKRMDFLLDGMYND